MTVEDAFGKYFTNLNGQAWKSRLSARARRLAFLKALPNYVPRGQICGFRKTISLFSKTQQGYYLLITKRALKTIAYWSSEMNARSCQLTKLNYPRHKVHCKSVFLQFTICWLPMQKCCTWPEGDSIILNGICTTTNFPEKQSPPYLPPRHNGDRKQWHFLRAPDNWPHVKLASAWLQSYLAGPGSVEAHLSEHKLREIAHLHVCRC